MRAPRARVLAAAGLVAAAALWLATLPGPSARSSPAARPDPPRLHARRAGGATDRLRSVRGAARRPVSVEPALDLPRPDRARVPASALHGSVRVRGQVRRGGRPVADSDLDFRLVGADADAPAADWDFTDEGGRYQVRLPADRYVVRIDEERSFTTDVLVPRGASELVLSFDLPPGEGRGRAVPAAR